MKPILVLSFLFSFFISTSAANATPVVDELSGLTENTETLRGTVYYTEGHHGPDCRTVAIDYMDGTTKKRKMFRINKTNGEDDVNSILLAAMVSNKEVELEFEEGVTSGCGGQPAIQRITLFK